METSQKYLPIRLLAVAPSQYGKTYQVCQFIQELIKRKELNPKRLIIISPTAKTDDSIQPLIKQASVKYKDFESKNIYEKVNSDFVSLLYETQKKIKELNPTKLKQYLILIDDSISDTEMHKKGSIMTTVATSGRHFGISTVILMQSYRNAMHPLIRSQTSCFLLGRLNSQSQVEDIADEFSMGLGQNAKESKKKFLELCEHCWASNDCHGFIVIWPYKQIHQGRIKKNLVGSEDIL